MSFLGFFKLFRLPLCCPNIAGLLLELLVLVPKGYCCLWYADGPGLDFGFGNFELLPEMLGPVRLLVDFIFY